MRILALLLVVDFVGACGGSAAVTAPPAAPAFDERDPHRHLTAEECGKVHDFMVEKGWMSAADAPREDVVRGCLDSPEATRAFYDCLLASATKEESDRCQ